MMNKEKLKKISKNLSANSDEFMSAFRKICLCILMKKI